MAGRIVTAPASQGLVSRFRPFSFHADGYKGQCSGRESTDMLGTSATANAETINFIHINVRDTTVLSRLGIAGSIFSKYALRYMHASYSGVVSSATSGEFAMALIYDAADEVAANWTVSRILKTHSCQTCPVWSSSNDVVYNPAHAAKPWYISGTTTGVGAQNEQTPVSIVYGYSCSLPSINIGRIHIDYKVELIDPIAPQANL